MSDLRWRPLLVLILITTCIGMANAQDTHYSTIQYGTKSTLLGGAVIGSVSDLSSVYYNPGATALFEDPSFIVSARVYEVNSLTVKDGGGEGVDLGRSTLKTAPDFIAGALRFQWLKGHKIAYTVLTRQRMSLGLATSATGTSELIAASPGEEDYAVGVRLNQDLSDTWAGVTWARTLSSRVGFGVTTFLGIRDQETRIQTLGAAVGTNGDVATIIRIDDFSYKTFRLLWKGGLAIDLGALTMGLSATTPGLNLSGSGQGSQADVSTGLDLDDDGQPDDLYLVDLQEGVAAEYKSPWSVGAGAALQLGRLQVHASAEWFDAVEKYAVLDLQPAQETTSGETVDTDLTREAKEVVNMALGARLRVGERLALFGSVATDNSAAPDSSTSNLSISNWDFVNVAGGAGFRVGSVELTLGLQFGQAEKEAERLVDVNPDESVSEDLNDPPATVVARRSKIIFGFSVGY